MATAFIINNNQNKHTWVLFMENNVLFFMFAVFFAFVFNIKKLNFSQHGKKLGKQSNWRSHF